MRSSFKVQNNVIVPTSNYSLQFSFEIFWVDYVRVIPPDWALFLQFSFEIFRVRESEKFELYLPESFNSPLRSSIWYEFTMNSMPVESLQFSFEIFWLFWLYLGFLSFTVYFKW